MLKETILKYLLNYTGLESVSPKIADPILYYSITQVFVAVLFAVGVAALIKWRHKLSYKWFIVAICTFMIVDLGRNAINYIDPYYYKVRYNNNFFYDYLRNNPGRVTFKQNPMPGSWSLYGTNDHWAGLAQEFMSHELPYHKIETLDMTQMPRALALDKKYLTFFNVGVDPKFWQLTGTKHVLAPYSVLTNNIPRRGQLRVLWRFDIENLTPMIKTDGEYALAEVVNSLNRFELYPKYYAITNEQLSLQILGADIFDPKTRLVVEKPVDFAPGHSPTNKLGINILSYKPNRISLSVTAETNSILLFNSRYSPDWHVKIDGEKVDTVRANYIMTGIPVAMGDHKIELKYQVTRIPLLITIGSIVGIAGVVLWLNRKDKNKL